MHHANANLKVPQGESRNSGSFSSGLWKSHIQCCQPANHKLTGCSTRGWDLLPGKGPMAPFSAAGPDLVKAKQSLQRAKHFFHLNSIFFVVVELLFKRQSMCSREINPNSAEREVRSEKSLSSSTRSYLSFPSLTSQKEVQANAYHSRIFLNMCASM